MAYPGDSTIAKHDVVLTTTSSSAVDISGRALVGVVIPASMVGTSLTFTVSVDGGSNYVALRDQAGNAITVTITNTAGFYSLRSAMPLGLREIRVASSSTSDDTKTVSLITQQVV